MNTYGIYAQKNFNYNASDLDDVDVSDVTLDELEPYKNTRSGEEPDGLTYSGSTLTLQTITLFTHYFTLAEGHTIDEYTFTDEKGPVEAVADGDGVYKVVFRDIPAKKLGEFQTLTISGHGKVYTIKYCPLSYARAAVKNNLEEANLCRALYKYYIAADEYFREEN